MTTIWKYPLKLVDGGQIYQIPKGAQLLHVDAQYGSPAMWYLVDDKAEIESRTFVVKGTGHPIHGPVTHVGSCVAPPFVWHVFEVPA